MLYPIQHPKFSNGKCLNISQGWGENCQLYMTNFGVPGHNGLDFVYLALNGLSQADASYGQPVLAAHSGKITYITWDGEHATKGNGIYLENDRYETVYWHLSKISVILGQEIKAGQEVGRMGNSGFVFPQPPPEHAGTHLHFGLRPLKNGTPMYPKNKFNGYVNPLPYLTMLDLLGNDQTKEQYIKDLNGILHRIANNETLNELHEGEIINKEAVLWLPPSDFSIYKIGSVLLMYNDD